MVVSDHNSPTVSEPFYKVTNDDHRALLVIFAVVFAVIVLGSIGTKLAIRHRIRTGTFDDSEWTLYTGAMLLLAYSACAVYSAKKGVGLHKMDDKVDVDAVQKTNYAMSILGTSAVFCAKLSMCIFIKKINDYGRMYMATRALCILVATTFVTGVMATLFQCPLPEPWVAENKWQCPSIARIYLYNGTMNALTDVLLCALSIAMIWHVQLSDGSKKGLVLVLFGTRLICPITIIPSLLSTQHLFSDDDFTWLALPPAIWQQASFGLSIITACTPSIKYVFDTFGGFTLAVEAPYELTAVPGKSGFQATATADQSSGGGSGGGSGGSSGGHMLLGSGRGGELAGDLSPWSHRYKTSCSADLGAAASGWRRVCPKKHDWQSESTRNLRCDVMITREVDIHVDDPEISSERHYESSDPGARSVST
ncbi:hypothetical protein PspLS_00719 [Pyricularia sp. CBS 133598]|nr:hypothetical protein PspLS_00719 [Pyricularia sp. CBS 133598]